MTYTALREDSSEDNAELRLRKYVSWGLVLFALLFLVGNGTYLTYNRSQRIAAEEAAKAEALRTELIVVSAPVALVMCDETATISLCNPAAEKMFGWEPGSLAGKKISVIVPPEFHEAHQKSFEAAIVRLQGVKQNWMIQRTCMPTEGFHKDGSRVPVSLSIRMIKYDGKIEFVASMRTPDEKPTTNSVPLPPLRIPDIRQQKR